MNFGGAVVILIVLTLAVLAAIWLVPPTGKFALE